MSDASDERQRIAEASPPSKPMFGGANLMRGLAVVALLAGGSFAGKYIMTSERPAAKSAHGGHGAEPEKGKDAHGHGKKDAHGGGKEAKGGHEGHDDHGEGKVVKLNPAQLKNAGLNIEPATAGVIRETVLLNGIVQPNEELVAAVLPRFGGVVRSVTKRLGEPVRKGEVVAKIESNESLTQYDLLAPLGGIVIERKGVLGEYADKDRRLMVIADLTNVWVDYRVYQQDFPKLKIGQAVEVTLNGTKRGAKIDYISPIGMTDTQSMLARVVIDNKDMAFRPGLYVNGRVLIGEQKVDVAVKQSAVQQINGKPVIFVETKEGFEARDVEFGLKDDEMVEIIFGAVKGDKVVTGNSFVLKAELGKGEATHEH